MVHTRADEDATLDILRDSPAVGVVVGMPRMAIHHPSSTVFVCQH
jgi:hypothetical protein